LTTLLAHRPRLGGALEAASKEIAAVAAILVVAMGVLGFLGVADGVTDGHTVVFDQGLMLMLHPGGSSRPIGPSWLEQTAIDLTALGSVTDLAIIVLLVAGLFAAQRRWREAGLLLAAPLSGLILVDIFKNAFGRQRPPIAMHAVVAGNASFPSGHAMLSAVVYLTLATLLAHFADRRRLRFFALTAGLLLSFVIGASRVYLGVHWPTDVMAGWALGAAWSMLWWLITWFVEHRRSRGRPSPAPALPQEPAKG
jgi:undecaprenyl-diphosphatase